MKCRILLGCVVLFFASLSLAARAELIPGAPTARLLELADADHDGFVTYDELRALMPGITPETFTYWDVNGQGSLRIADYNGPLPQDLLENSSDILNVVDADGDGVITFEEAVAAFSSLTRAEFDGMDVNGDGGLTDADLPPLPTDETTLLLYEVIETTEADGLTDVTFAEAQQYYPDLTHTQFSEMDCTGNGLLSRADFPESVPVTAGLEAPVLEKPGSLEKALKAAPVAVPNVVGMSQIAARAAITNALLAIGTSVWQYSATVPSGNVISEVPVAGTVVATGTAVNLVVSYANNPILVPNVVGSAQSAAQAAITSAALALGTIVKQYSSTVPANNVISEDPVAGTRVAASTPVNLIVSLGAPSVVVPNVVGSTQSSAQTAITGAGLAIGIITQQSSATVPAGNVISQSPAAGTSVAAGTSINLVVSLGPTPVIVPNVVDSPQASAQTTITGAGLTVGVIAQQSSATVPAGNVISQNPAAGTSVNPGTVVNLVVSLGPTPVTVPNVVGSPQSNAQTAITGAGLTVGDVTRQQSATVPAGNVISQSPAAGTSVAPGTAVSLVVSLGAAPVTVPNVVGSPQAGAQTAITGAGLTVGTITQQQSATVAAGIVISQNPAAGASVAPGTAVTLVVSLGADTATVPNVVGLTQADAQTAITAAILTLGAVTQQFSTTVPEGDVITQNPAAGTQAARGAAVSLVISKGPQLTTVPALTGLAQAAAQAAILNANLSVGLITPQPSPTIGSGIVIGQDPAPGLSVSVGTPVNIIVSTGPTPVTVPEVVGAIQSTAQIAILNAGLIVGTITTQSSNSVPAGNVISQNPAGGSSVAPGTPVNLVVSNGPLAVTVPNVIGLIELDANTVLARASLAIGGIAQQFSGSIPSGEVVSQDPAAGVAVSPGTAVNLVVSIGADPGGALEVAIEPAEAVTAGAQWSVDGGPLQASGAKITGLSVGVHVVTFKDITPAPSPGCFSAPAQEWNTPAAQTVSIVRNQTTNVTGTYTAAKAALAGFATSGANGDILLMVSAAATLLLVRRNKAVKVKPD